MTGSVVGHELVEHLFPLYDGRTGEVAEKLDMIREEYTTLAHMVADVSVISPDQTLAIRKLHEACQAAIFAVVAHESTKVVSGNE